MYRCYNVMSSGQQVFSGNVNIRDSAAAILQSHKKGLSADQVAKFKTLLGKCYGGCPFTPLDCFNMSLSTGIAAATTAASYVLCLLQFKDIESRSVA